MRNFSTSNARTIRVTIDPDFYMGTVRATLLATALLKAFSNDKACTSETHLHSQVQAIRNRLCGSCVDVIPNVAYIGENRIVWAVDNCGLTPSESGVVHEFANWIYNPDNLSKSFVYVNLNEGKSLVVIRQVLRASALCAEEPENAQEVYPVKAGLTF